MGEQKIKIMIVDNSKEFCDILNDYILMQNDMVVTGIAENGIEALKLFEEEQPDLIVLDIIMPILDGLGVIEKLNTMNLDPMPHIIILSAVGQKKIIQRAISLGADYYIVKPFDMEVFIKRIRKLLNKNTDNEDVKISLTNSDKAKSKINISM
ncbi:response regulator [Clostridium psychrophilum]|nr:response regulator [Clostridium psychrophilum]